MQRRSLLVGAASAVVLTGCASKFQTYQGPDVTYVVVNKTSRKMYLFHGQQVLRSYSVDLGFAPAGPKQFEGDGKTPEGNYVIDRRNPDSSYHLSLGISYPNAQDRAFATAHGRSPGGDIFIHGKANRWGKGRGDWTAGCIAVKNREIEEVYAMVRNGTPIQING